MTFSRVLDFCYASRDSSPTSLRSWGSRLLAVASPRKASGIVVTSSKWWSRLNEIKEVYRVELHFRDHSAHRHSIAKLSASWDLFACSLPEIACWGPVKCRLKFVCISRKSGIFMRNPQPHIDISNFIFFFKKSSLSLSSTFSKNHRHVWQVHFNHHQDFQCFFATHCGCLQMSPTLLTCFRSIDVCATCVAWPDYFTIINYFFEKITKMRFDLGGQGSPPRHGLQKSFQVPTYSDAIFCSWLAFFLVDLYIYIFFLLWCSWLVASILMIRKTTSWYQTQRQKGGGKQIEKEEEHVETCENERIMGWYALKHFKFAGKKVWKSRKTRSFNLVTFRDFCNTSDRVTGWWFWWWFFDNVFDDSLKKLELFLNFLDFLPKKLKIFNFDDLVMIFW